MAADEPVVSPADAARAEAARQLVILVFGIAGAVALVWLQRTVAQPDAARSARMRVAKASERCHARLAKWAWSRAEAARVAYEKDTS